jgi:hypothetical protein
VKLSIWRKLLHFLILSRWRRWLLPVLCTAPYAASLLWLIHINEAWIAQVLLAPLLMAVVLALITFWLAQEEFYR